MPDIFLALADRTRREILQMIAQRPRAAGEVARAFIQQRPAISKHLAVLKKAGLIAERRDRQSRIYSLNAAGLLPLRAYLGVLSSETSINQGPGTAISANSGAVVRVAAKPRDLGPLDDRDLIRSRAPIAPGPAPASKATPADERSAEGPIRRVTPGQWDLDFD